MLKKYLDDNLAKEFIRLSSFSTALSILFTRKPDEELRLYVDYCTLNVIIIKN